MFDRNREPTCKPVAFLFLGETLLLPHLYPILARFADLREERSIDAWTSTKVHEDLLTRWIAEDGITDKVRLRRAPGWKDTGASGPGENPVLPAKMPMLLRLVPALTKTEAVVCAEQTSLWLPLVFPFMPSFIKTSHGVGTMSARDDRRRKAATLTLVPSEMERSTYLQRGMKPEFITATGYVKAGFRHLAVQRPKFGHDRPVILYNPHWRPSRSSWWNWGRQAIQAILASGRYNLIFAPHQRLAEGEPDLRRFCEELNKRDDAIADMQSFAAVDGSYPVASDIYVGDTSSQVLEFLTKPRPAIFLNSEGQDWMADPELAMWSCGEVVSDISDLLAGIDRAIARQSDHAGAQVAFVSKWLGRADGTGPERAATEIAAFLSRR